MTAFDRRVNLGGEEFPEAPKFVAGHSLAGARMVDVARGCTAGRASGPSGNVGPWVSLEGRLSAD